MQNSRRPLHKKERNEIEDLNHQIGAKILKGTLLKTTDREVLVKVAAVERKEKHSKKAKLKNLHWLPCDYGKKYRGREHKT